MEKTAINDSEHIIDARLQGFDISKLPAPSTVDFFGCNEDTVFIQFHNGVSYLYPGVEKKDMVRFKKADNIGRFMSELSKKYQFTKIALQLVQSKNQQAE